MPAATNAAIPTRLSPEESSAAGRAQRAQSSSGLPPYTGDVCTHPECSGKALYTLGNHFACATHKGWIEVITRRSVSVYCTQVINEVKHLRSTARPDFYHPADVAFRLQELA